VIGLNDSGAPAFRRLCRRRIWDIFLRNSWHPVIPQITDLGPCAVAQSIPGIDDFILMVRNSSLYVRHRTRYRQVCTPKSGFEGLGGASIHTKNRGYPTSGDSEADTLFLSQSWLSTPDTWRMSFVNGGRRSSSTEVALDTIIRTIPVAYDMHEVIRLVMDKAEFSKFRKRMLPIF